MRNQPLIFTEQGIIPRLIDAILTLVAWFAFSYLIYNGLIKAIEHSPTMGLRPITTTLNTISFYVIVALLNGLTLIVWAKYNQFRFRVERRSRRPGIQDSELAVSLNITDAQVQELNSGRVLTVFHDEHGDIAHVEVTRAMDDQRPLPVESFSKESVHNSVSH